MKDNKPLYLQIEADIRNKILNKKYLHGEQLPTEDQLCSIYDVSKITIRKALSILVKKDFVERIRGKGTFVKLNKEKITLGSSHGFSQALNKKGHIIRNTILSTKIRTPDVKLANTLNMDLNDNIVDIKRLICEDGAPIGIDNFYAEYKNIPGFLDAFNKELSIYKLLEKEYNLSVDRSVVEINGTVASKKQADLLQCFVGDPLFIVNKISYTKNDKIIHFSSSTIRCDRVNYIINIDKNGKANTISINH